MYVYVCMHLGHVPMNGKFQKDSYSYKKGKQNTVKIEE